MRSIDFTIGILFKRYAQNQNERSETDKSKSSYPYTFSFCYFIVSNNEKFIFMEFIVGEDIQTPTKFGSFIL